MDKRLEKLLTRESSSGLTETGTVTCTSLNDVWPGSCGNFFPGYQARILASDGSDVSGIDAPGELLLKSPSITLGYLNNDAANNELFTEDGWMRTGDMAVIRVSPNGFEHVCILDRIKELIKVKVQSPLSHGLCKNNH